MFQEDFTAFFSTAEFAHTANFGAADVAVIFDDGYAPGSVGPVGMAGSQPVITLPSAHVPANPVGLSVAVTVGGVQRGYLVADAHPDGTGITRLVLEAAL